MHPAQIPLALHRGALAVVVSAALIAAVLLCVRLWHGPYHDTLLDGWEATSLTLFFLVAIAALLAWGLRAQLGACALLLTALLAIGLLRNVWTLLAGPQRVWALGSLLLTLGELYFVIGAIRAIILTRRLEKLGGAGAKLEQQLASAKCRKALTAAPYLRRSLLIARLLGLGAVVTATVLLLTCGSLASSLGRYSSRADPGELAIVLAVGLVGAGGFVFSLALGWFAHCLSAEVRRFQLAAAYNALSRVLTIYRFFQVTAILVLIGSTLLSLGQMGDSSEGLGRLALHAVFDVAGIWVTAKVAKQFRQAKDDLYRFDPGPMWVGGERHADLGMICGRIMAAALVIAAVFGVTLAAGSQADGRVREQANLLPRARDELAAGRPAEALALLERHLQAAAISPAALEIRADAYSALHRDAEARRDAEALVNAPGAMQHQRVSACETLAAVSERARDWPGAIAAINRAMALHPDEAFHYFRRAKFEEQIPDLAAARQDYEKAVELAPRYVPPLYCLGYLARQAGDRDGALARWRQAEAALEKDRDNLAIAYYPLLGLSYEKLGLKAPALLCFVRMFDRDWKTRGGGFPNYSYLDDADSATVRRLRELALKVYPDHQKRELIYPVFLASGLAAEGKAECERLLLKNPGDAPVRTSLAWLLFHTGDYAGAARNFQQAAELPGHPTLQQRLRLAKAGAQWAGGDREAALQTYAELAGEDNYWRDETALNRLEWLAGEVQPVREARLALLQRPSIFHSPEEPRYRLALDPAWELRGDMNGQTDLAATRGDFSLTVATVGETAEQVRAALRSNLEAHDAVNAWGDSLWGSSPVTITERSLEVNGIRWTALKAENAACRKHGLYCTQAGRVVVLALLEKSLGEGTKSPLDEVLAGFRFDGVEPPASLPTPSPTPEPAKPALTPAVTPAPSAPPSAPIKKPVRRGRS